MDYPQELLPHLVTKDLVAKAIIEPEPDSHKGENGTLLVIGGSPLFHGAGRLTAEGAEQTLLSLNQTINFGSKYTDYVIFCSTKENLDYIKARQDAFIGITRESLADYLPKADAIVIGTGMMREREPGDPSTTHEPEITKELTSSVLAAKRKTVLDAGSLQVSTPEDLRDHEQLIITPHRTEMANLFGLSADELFLKQEAASDEIFRVGEKIYGLAKHYRLTILLKGPIDIIAGENFWYFSPGGDAAMTKGGTGDVLAGVTGALYTKLDDPLLAAAAASFLTKRAGKYLRQTSGQFYNATDLARDGVSAAIKALRSSNQPQ